MLRFLAPVMLAVPLLTVWFSFAIACPTGGEAVDRDPPTDTDGFASAPDAEPNPDPGLNNGR